MTRQWGQRRSLSLYGRATALVVCLALLAAACGGGGDDPEPGAAEDPALEDEGDGASGDDDAAEVDDLGDVVHFTDGAMDTSSGVGAGLEAARLEFERANVTLDGAPFAEFVAAATTRARAGELGDVVSMLPGLNYAPIWPALIELTPDDFPDEYAALEGWGAGAIDPSDPETVSGVPFGAQGVVWYYNKTLFEEAGLDPESPPTTWDEFEDAAEALSDAGIVPLMMSGVDSFIAWWAWSAWSPQFYSEPADVLAIRSGETPLTDDGLRLALEAVKETYDRGWWNDDFQDKAFPEAEAAFGRGEAAMIAGLISDAANWQTWDATLGEGNYGVFTAPLLDGATTRRQFFNPTTILGIYNQTENEAGARAWISFLTSAEGQTIMLREAGRFPNRSDVDVLGVTGSEGAQAIVEIVSDVGGSDVPQNQFTAGAQSTALSQLTTAITTDDLDGFLRSLQQQQEQG